MNNPGSSMLEGISSIVISFINLEYTQHLDRSSGGFFRIQILKLHNAIITFDGVHRMLPILPNII